MSSSGMPELSDTRLSSLGPRLVEWRPTPHHRLGQGQQLGAVAQRSSGEPDDLEALAGRLREVPAMGERVGRSEPDKRRARHLAERGHAITRGWSASLPARGVPVTPLAKNH